MVLLKIKPKEKANNVMEEIIELKPEVKEFLRDKVNQGLINNNEWKQLIYNAAKEGREVLFGAWEALIDVDKNQPIKNMDIGFGEEVVKIICNYEFLEKAIK